MAYFSLVLQSVLGASMAVPAASCRSQWRSKRPLPKFDSGRFPANDIDDDS